MKTFYAFNRPAVLLDDRGYTRLFNGGAGTLATHQKNHSRLIGSEMSSSPSCTLGRDGRTQTIFSAYGASIDHGQIPAFKGELQDLATGHYLLGNGYRAYNPHLMRFHSPDSESPFAKGGLNTYAFALCDPINRSDPTGHVTGLIQKLFVKKTYRGPIVAEFDAIVVFTGPTRRDARLPTLYISAHGAPGVISADHFNTYDAKRLHKALTSRGIEMRNRQTHVLTCYSAAPNRLTGTSFIEDLNDHTGGQSSGYETLVPVVESREGSQFVAEKQRVLLYPGMTSEKTRVGESKKPQGDVGAFRTGKPWVMTV
ncbi:TPA: RHS repeat-associated core domain-containing protein [Pseudomonas putida]|uniref:RHS repeat-associated core domain-containing protein n=1 Tax=Pseudomonas putida TaxID=303 RepID=UPI003734718B